MPRYTLPVVALVVAVLAGCDPKPTPPGTDAESIKKLEQLQKQGSQGEQGNESKKK